MNPSPDHVSSADDGHQPPDFTTLLTEAIQLYADAVAAHALQSEGVLGTGEDGEAVADARARLRRLLALIPPLPIPNDERLSPKPRTPSPVEPGEGVGGKGRR